MNATIKRKLYAYFPLLYRDTSNERSCMKWGAARWLRLPILDSVNIWLLDQFQPSVDSKKLRTKNLFQP